MSDLAVTNKKALVSLLGSAGIKDKLNDILGKNAATFATSIVQIQSQNKMLAEATPESIVGAAMTAATLNLPLNNQLGHAYIVPFREKQDDNTWLVKAQFMLGYKGLKQLCTRSGLFKFNNVREVKKGEVTHFDYLTGEVDFTWEQDYAKRASLDTVGYVHYYELTSGYKSTKIMTLEELTAHGKKFSKTFAKGFGNWVDEYDKMCMKTITKLHLNEGDAPLTIDIQTAIVKDQANIELDDKGDEKVNYPDNEPDKKIDYDKERMMSLITDAKTLEDIDSAKLHVDKEHMPALQAKELLIKKGQPKN